MKSARRTWDHPALWRLGTTAPPREPHVALAPGADLPLLPLTLPDKLKGIARDRVGRRLLAERLAVPLDGLEVMPLARKGRPWTRAIVADADRLADWRKQLGPQCQALLPDYMALPCAPGVWTVEATEDMVIARLGPDDGFTAEPGLAALMLSEAAAAGKPTAVLRLGTALPDLDAQLAATGAPVFADLAALTRAGHPAPLRWSEAVHGLDLKSPPSATFDRLRTRVRAWTAPVALALLALAVWLGGVAWQAAGLRDRAALARADTQAMVRAHFVPTGPILDIRAQVGAALAGRTAPPPEPTEPLILFQTAAPVLTGETVALQAVSYRADTGLVAAVELTDFAALEQLEADLRSLGFAVETLDSSARQQGGVAARLRLAETGE